MTAVLPAVDIELSNIDFFIILPKITRKTFSVRRYEDLLSRPLTYYNIILFYYPNNPGHWCLLKVDDYNKSLYFFDPYGRSADDQWPYLYNRNNLVPPPPLLSTLIYNYRLKSYVYDYNPYNIQGYFVANSSAKRIAEHECGEIVAYRILRHHLSDLNFYLECKRLGPIKVFKIIKRLEDEDVKGYYSSLP